MKTATSTILTVNAGSSSIKFALYELQGLKQLFYGEIENLGTENTQLNFVNSITNQSRNFMMGVCERSTLIHFLIEWLKIQDGFTSVKAIGHRIVQGMQHKQPEKITPELLQSLKEMSAYDPEHLPGEIELIEAFRENFPDLEQIVCFDTAFHAEMPKVATLLAIPRKYYEKGIQRYGFHGLSYSYLMEELNRSAGPEETKGKIIIAHLGSGASLVAIKDGKSIDTSMGFTPTSGLPMSTRCGDLDPGVAFYLIKQEKLGPEKFNQLINHQSGLLGISETSSDMRKLLACQNTDSRAFEALELFCYQTKKWIGSFAAALGGLNTLIFSGGIGENIPEVRERICKNLQFLGIELDETKNKNNEAIISLKNTNVTVRVINTNEELMIAQLVSGIMNDSDNTNNYDKGKHKQTS
jgi:acetate kinase